MSCIEPISGNKIKEICKLHQKKYREQTGLFIAEGLKSVQELLSANVEIIEIFASKEFNLKANIKTVDESVLKKISTTDSPCEILAIARKKSTDLALLKSKKHLILLENISDPGNLGTIIRSASAFNIDGIILYGNCVELYSPKVIRSSAGNFFKTPVAQLSDINVLKSEFSDYKKIATSLSDKNNISIRECTNFDKYIIMFGSEASGLSPDLVKLADRNIRIDMSKGVESLNLSVTASIVLYELYLK